MAVWSFQLAFSWISVPEQSCNWNCLGAAAAAAAAILVGASCNLQKLYKLMSFPVGFSQTVLLNSSVLH